MGNVNFNFNFNSAAEGIEDLRKALEFDAEAKHDSAKRARALLLSLREAAQKQAAN